MYTDFIKKNEGSKLYKTPKEINIKMVIFVFYFRVTILCNKFDGQPKGFAYVEFADKDSVSTAMALDDSLFRGRQIKVVHKLFKMLCFLIYFTSTDINLFVSRKSLIRIFPTMQLFDLQKSFVIHNKRTQIQKVILYLKTSIQK